jgi:hypothetical protein
MFSFAIVWMLRVVGGNVQKRTQMLHVHWLQFYFWVVFHFWFKNFGTFIVRILECKNVLLTVRHFYTQMWNRIVATNGYWKTLSPFFMISDNNCIIVQSNLCKTTTLGTPKKWPLYRGGRSLEVFQSKLVLKLIWPDLAWP